MLTINVFKIRILHKVIPVKTLSNLIEFSFFSSENLFIIVLVQHKEKPLGRIFEECFMKALFLTIISLTMIKTLKTFYLLIHTKRLRNV